MSKPCVAVFSLAYHPFVGGAEIAVKEIISRNPASDFVILTKKFDRAWPSAESSDNCSILRLGRGEISPRSYYGGFFGKIFYIFQAVRVAEKIHRSQPFSAIWGMMASYAGIAALIFKLRHPSVPFLLTLQEGDSEAHILRKVGIFYPFWRKIFKKADSIQVISRYLANFARRHGAICPIEVIPNGVDLSDYGTDRTYESYKTNTSNEPYVIITTSRLVHKNGVDILIASLPLLHTTNYKLLILGDGPDKEKLKDLAIQLGVSDKIEFLGHVEPDLIPSYLLQATIFVRASRSEGLGNSFLEAMAAGLPVIGTPVGGIPDFLKDGETGIFCRVDDPKDLARKINLLIENKDLYKKISESGRVLVAKNYSWDEISSKMSLIFQSLNTKYLLLTTRLLIATGIYPPDIGGPATYTVLMEKELPKRGFAVDHLAFTDYRKKPKVIRHFLYLWDCWRKAKNFDAIYAQDPVSVGLPALIAARLRGKKFFIRVAGDYAWEQSAQRFGVKETIDEFQNKKYGFRVGVLRAIQRFVVGRADLVITPSNYFRKLVGGWIKNPEKVKTIYNGIELERIQKTNLQNSNAKLIASTGRLVPWKGFDVLIELMKEEDLKDWSLRIYGDGPDKQKLQNLISKNDLQDRVLLVGAQDRKTLLSDAEAASIFVLNTTFESFSFQVVEEMYRGVPVVTTNIGSLPELIENNKEGILVEPNNKGQILDAIKKISQDEAFRELIVKNAQEKAQQFSITRTVDNLVKLISN
ncbi:MAG: glycosyltransferase family 4 protein [bacterium]|nr:glycosyltransferase family 4 protein [bacterium]